MALSFNGTTSKLEWAGNIGGETPMSIFCWVKPTSAAADYAVCGPGDNGGEQEQWLFAAGSVGFMRAYSRDSAATSSFATSTTAMSTAWLPALAVYTSDNSRTIYYGAGAAVTDTTNVGSGGVFDRFIVGMRPKDGTLPFSGEIAEVAVWSSALSQANFDSLAAGALPESVASGSLLDSWSLLTQAASQVGTVSRTLTATDTSQGGAHPISRSVASASKTTHLSMLGIG